MRRCNRFVVVDYDQWIITYSRLEWICRQSANRRDAVAHVATLSYYFLRAPLYGIARYMRRTGVSPSVRHTPVHISTLKVFLKIIARTQTQRNDLCTAGQYGHVPFGQHLVLLRLPKWSTINCHWILAYSYTTFALSYFHNWHDYLH